MEARDKGEQMIEIVRPKNKSYLAELEMGRGGEWKVKSWWRGDGRSASGQYAKKEYRVRRLFGCLTLVSDSSITLPT